MQIDYHAHKSSISLTPLIDVVFILLLFFMLSSRFQQDQGITLQLPKPIPTVAGPETIKPLRVSVEANGLLLFAGELFSAEQLTARFPLRSRKGVSIAADTEITTQQLVTAMEELKTQGLRHIKLERPHVAQ